MIIASRNVAGFIIRESIVRSMFETTNTNETPGNRILGIAAVVFKINYVPKTAILEALKIPRFMINALKIP